MILRRHRSTFPLAEFLLNDKQETYTYPVTFVVTLLLCAHVVQLEAQNDFCPLTAFDKEADQLLRSLPNYFTW